MNFVVLILAGFAGIVGTVYGLPPGTSDPCMNYPCGRGAKCQTMTAIAVCTCPADSSGDPFVDCNSISEQNAPSPESVSTSQPALVHFTSSVPITSNEGLPHQTVEFLKSTNSAFTNFGFQMSTNFNRMPIRGSDFTPTDSSVNLNTQRFSPTSGMKIESPASDPFEPKTPSLNYIRYPEVDISQMKKTPELSQNSFVKDPLGQYSNCRSVNNIVVCADNSVDDTLPMPTSHQNGNGNNRIQGHVGSQPPQKYLERDQISDDLNTPQYYPHGQHHIASHIPIVHESPSTNFGNMETQRLNLNVPEGNRDSLCNSMCGINSICRMFLGRPVCGCSEGHTGDPSVKCEVIESELSSKPGCEKHIDCSSTEICLESKCTDPCKNSSVQNEKPLTMITVERKHSSVEPEMCGRNAKCIVIGHTPLCGCLDGFYGNPYVSCVQ